MKKLLDLIEQVRFAELDKITKMSKDQELYLKGEEEIVSNSVK